MQCQIETNNFVKLKNASIHDISELDCCSLRKSNCNKSNPIYANGKEGV